MFPSDSTAIYLPHPSVANNLVYQENDDNRGDVLNENYGADGELAKLGAVILC